MRIAKYLAAAGIASRRKSEELIQQGRILVDGKQVTELGMQIDPAKDVVTVDGRAVAIEEKRIYIMFNKPIGCISACADDRGRKTVLDYIKDTDTRIYPIGRLDFTTEGLLLLTNDGELAHKLTHPKHEIDKRYYVVVDSLVKPEQIKQLEGGVVLDGKKTASARISISKAEKGRTELTISIHEGRNRQVRRMFETIGKNVVFLKRISVGKLQLDRLKKGEYRYLTEEEIAYLKSL